MWQPAKFLQCLITSVLVSSKLISYLKENIKFNKLPVPVWRAAESTLIFSCETAHYSCSIRPGYCVVKNMFLQDTVFEETFWLPLIGFDINVKYIGKGKNMKIYQSFKFATEFGNLFKLERKKAEIRKNLIIQKYEMVYVLK